MQIICMQMSIHVMICRWFVKHSWWKGDTSRSVRVYEPVQNRAIISTLFGIEDAFCEFMITILSQQKLVVSETLLY